MQSAVDRTCVNWSSADHMNIYEKKDEGNDNWSTATTITTYTSLISHLWRSGQAVDRLLSLNHLN